MAGIDPAIALDHIRRLVLLAGREEHTLRRPDALFAVASSIRSHFALLETVVPALTEALLAGRGWRIDRLIRSTLEIVWPTMREVADRLIEHHSDGKKKVALVASFRNASG
jgi:hypothetical protein